MQRQKYITLYHGTDVESALHILAEGLKADVQKFDMTDATDERRGTIHGFDDDHLYNPARDDKRGFIYVTPYQRLAADFARVRVTYYRAKIGSTFALPGRFSPDRCGMPPQRKHSGPYRPGAKGAVIKLRLPVSWEHNGDPQCIGGYRVPDHIPAQYIIGAYTLNRKPIRTVDTVVTATPQRLNAMVVAA